VVGDGGGSSKPLDPTDGVNSSSLGSSSSGVDGAGGAVAERSPPITGGVPGIVAGGAELIMLIESNLVITVQT
jgi:hypothetical protein